MAHLVYSCFNALTGSLQRFLGPKWIKETSITEGPAKEGIEERDAFIKNIMGPKYNEEDFQLILFLLGDRYDSLEALLTIPIPIYDDPLRPTGGPSCLPKSVGIHRLYYSGAEEKLLYNFARCGKFGLGRILMNGIQQENYSRQSKEWGWDNGACCEQWPHWERPCHPLMTRKKRPKWWKTKTDQDTEKEKEEFKQLMMQRVARGREKME